MIATYLRWYIDTFETFENSDSGLEANHFAFLVLLWLSSIPRMLLNFGEPSWDSITFTPYPNKEFWIRSVYVTRFLYSSVMIAVYIARRNRPSGERVVGDRKRWYRNSVVQYGFTLGAHAYIMGSNLPYIADLWILPPLMIVFQIVSVR
eukprot:PhF_6_TR584/c0_g1_i4/m.635